MSENPLTSHAAGLDIPALLYACGDMEPDEAAAFEARLADDQQARDALVNAIRLLAPLSENVGPGPDYREIVRRR